jgi:hypothetical protein
MGMAEGQGKTIRVAAVQIVCENGLIDKNPAHTVKLLDEAAQKGAADYGYPFMLLSRS